MFRKLLKYEWKANSGLLGILSLAAVGVGLLGTIVLRVLVNYGKELADSESAAVMMIFPLGMLVGFCFLALVVYVAAVNFVQLYRFYKNKFTDEGYLTFTLPVKPSRIFLASGLVMLAWQLIAVVLVILLIALIILCGTATEGLFNKEIFTGYNEISYVFREIFGVLNSNLGDGYGVLSVVNVAIAPVYGVVLSMTYITLGAVLAKKHKILAAIGISYAGSMVISVLTSVITAIPSVMLLNSPSSDAMATYYTVSAVVQLVIYVGLTVGGYFLSTGLMKHKLNLP